MAFYANASLLFLFRLFGLAGFPWGSHYPSGFVLPLQRIPGLLILSVESLLLVAGLSE